MIFSTLKIEYTFCRPCNFPVASQVLQSKLWARRAGKTRLNANRFWKGKRHVIHPIEWSMEGNMTK